jgi:DNA-binding LacI/PurR family transcriptional regulator
MSPSQPLHEDLIPKRSSLVAQTVAILRNHLRAGVWKEYLPGEHDLCERLQISRVTLRAALDQLQREKWIRAGQGRRRQIVAHRIPRPARSQSNVVVLLSPVSILTLPTSALFWVDALREHLAAAGYRLEFHTSQACYTEHPGRAIETMVQQLNAAAWVLYLSTEALQRAFSDRGLPCVIAGSPHPSVELSSVDIDYAATCRHAAGMLAARGRRRIALLMPRSGQAGNLQSERAFQEAGESLRASGVETLIVHHDGTPEGVCRRLDALLEVAKPVDGLLVAKPAHVVTAVSHLLRKGVKIPQQVALISRDNDPFLESLVPAVARYERNPTLFARKVLRLVLDLVREGVRPRHNFRLMPTLVSGETLGPKVGAA